MRTVKRKISYRNYLAGLIIASLFLIAGLFLSRYIAEKKAEELAISQKAISALLNIIELKERISENGEMDYCNISHEFIWKEKVDIGGILTILEQRLGKDNKDVKKQKAIYNAVQFKTLKLAEKVNENCNLSWEIILFFYTNDKKDETGDYKLSELQGYALDGVYLSDKDKVKTFSFDTSLKEPNTLALMQKYSVEKTPSLVINGKLYGRFMARNEIRKILAE